MLPIRGERNLSVNVDVVSANAKPVRALCHLTSSTGDGAVGVVRGYEGGDDFVGIGGGHSSEWGGIGGVIGEASPTDDIAERFLYVDVDTRESVGVRAVEDIG